MKAGTLRHVGIVGIVATVLLAILNVAHPVGSTEQYGDAAVFIDKMNTWWVIDHLLVALVLLATPFVLWAWQQTLAGELARSWGQFGVMLAVIGTTIGTIHLAGIDGTALPAFGDVLAAEGNSAESLAAASALLKVHFMTFTSWLLVIWIAMPVVVAVAVWLDRNQPRGIAVLAVVGAAFSIASLVVQLTEGQLTTLSEGGLFRPSSVALTIWFFWISYRLYKTKEDVGAVAVSA